MRKNNGLILPEKQKFCDLYGQYIGFGGYTPSGVDVVSVSKSAMYVVGNDEYLSRTPSSGGSQTTWTFSVWTNGTAYFSAYNGSGTPLGASMVYFNSRQLTVGNYNNSSGWTILREFTPYWRDPSGWYNLVAVYDSTNDVEENRIRIYVNGVRYIEDSGTVHHPTDGETMAINSTVAHNVGKWTNRSGFSNDGYTAETVFLDGTAVTDASSFGQFDSTGLYWTPKSSADIKELTFGTNGFYLDNTTNAQTDASGQGNNWTNNNTVVTTNHTPTNLYPVLDVNAKWNSGTSTVTYSEGNRKVALTSANGTTTGIPTFGVPGSGKWVFEATFSTIAETAAMGIIPASKLRSTPALSGDAYGWNGMQMYLKGNSGRIYDNGSVVVTETDPDISNGTTITCEVDLDTPTIKWYNGGSLLGTYEASDGLSISEDFYLLQATCNDSGAVWTTNWGQDDFNRTVTAGFKAPSTTNIAAATTRTASDINKYFQTTLYEGNGAGQRVGAFQPFTDTFTVGNSALFNGSNNYLNRTQSSGSNTVWTFSAWIKKCENKNTVFLNFSTGTPQGQLGFNASNQFYLYNGATVVGLTTQTWEDASQWNHFHVAYNTGESGTDKVKLTVNGVLITSWATDNRSTASGFHDANQSGEVVVVGNNGYYGGDAISLNGYMAECVLLDGTASAASNFGKTDATSNRWVPKDVSGLDYSGANSFYLQFGSSGSDLGDDDSGEGNDLANNNSVAQSTDSPTTNFNTYDSNESSGTFSTGNTISLAGNNSINIGTLPMHSGKWVFEATGTTSSLSAHFVGVAGPLMPTGNGGTQGGLSDGYMLQNDANLFIDGSDSGLNASATWTTNDVIRLEIDRDNHTLQWFKNGSSILSIKNVYDKNWRTCTSYATFMATTMNSGATSFDGTPTTGFNAISQDNMTSTNQFISALSWIKNRDATDNHMLFDRVRGVTKDIHSNDTAVEVTNVNTLQSFLSAGVQVGDDVEVNTANESYVLWNWMMEATGSGTSNEDGSVNTTRTLVDTTLGLSINLVPVPASGDFTIGHGLGVIPKFIIVKGLEATDNWVIHARATMSDTTDYILFTTAAQVNSGTNVFGASLPTSSVIGLSAGSTCAASKDAIVFAFADSQFISTGMYYGNGASDGQRVYTYSSLGIPIQPKWIMVKRTDGAGEDWVIQDAARDVYNEFDMKIAPSSNAVEAAKDANDAFRCDFLTGGFKLRTTGYTSNKASSTYVYLAIGTPMIDTDGRIIGGG